MKSIIKNCILIGVYVSAVIQLIAGNEIAALLLIVIGLLSEINIKLGDK